MENVRAELLTAIRSGAPRPRVDFHQDVPDLSRSVCPAGSDLQTEGRRSAFLEADLERLAEVLRASRASIDHPPPPALVESAVEGEEALRRPVEKHGEA